MKKRWSKIFVKIAHIIHGSDLCKFILRAPRVCRQWLERLDGEGKKCSVFFTFGGFGKDPAHYYIKELLEKRGFTLVSTAEFLAVHTFNRCGWNAAESCQNASNFKAIEEFTHKKLRRFTGEDPNVISNFEKPIYPPDQLDMAEKFRFKLITQFPARDAQICSMCMLCKMLEPVPPCTGSGRISYSVHKPIRTTGVAR